MYGGGYCLPVTYIGIYLNDHLAAGAAGIELAKRCRRSNEGTPLADDLTQIIREIEEDAATVRKCLELVGGKPNPAKIAATRAGEFVGRLKLNGQLRGYSPLSRLLELEMLISGIDGRRSLLTALTVADRPELASFDFAALADRAAAQRDRLIPYHRDAARVALAGDSSLTRVSPVQNSEAREPSSTGER